MTNVYMIRLIMCISSLLAVYLFIMLNMPLPWLLGPTTATVLLKLRYPAQVICPIKFRNIFLIPLGYGIGVNVTPQACNEMLGQFNGIVLATFICIGLSVILAWWTARSVGVDIASSTIGTMPGGLTPMLLVCENIPRADVSVVAVLQSMRLMGSIFAVPFLLMHVIDVAPTAAAGGVAAASVVYAGVSVWQLVLVVCAGVIIGHFLRIPGEFLLGPIVATAAFSVYMGNQLPGAPQWLVSMAQIVTGVYLGTCIDPFQLGKNRKLLPVGLAGVLIMIVSCMVIGYILSFLYGFSLATAFLATAPGGVAEMCLTGMVMGENVAIILSYQLFRMLFLSFVMPVILQWHFTRQDRLAKGI